MLFTKKSLTRRLLTAACAAALAMTPAVAGTLQTGISASLSIHYIGPATLGSQAFDLAPAQQLLPAMSTGTGINQADLVYVATRTIAPSGTDPLDLNGVLTDPFGTVLACLHVKAIRVKAAAGNANNVVIGAGSNPFLGPFAGTTPTVATAPGGVTMLIAPQAGWVVTPATGDILQLANSGAGTGVTYDIIVICTST